MRPFSLLFVFVLVILIASSESAEEKKKKKSKKNKNIQADAPKKPRQPIYEEYDYDQNYHDEDFKEENNEETTEVFRQPDDEHEVRTERLEVGSILAPFSCLFEDTWYREREEFRMGQDQCSICLCVGGQVKCNDESCPRTTPKPPPTTTTQKPVVGNFCNFNY